MGTHGEVQLNLEAFLTQTMRKLRPPNQYLRKLDQCIMEKTIGDNRPPYQRNLINPIY